MIPIHGHSDKDESFVILRGKVRSTTYNDDGSVIDSIILSHEDGIYGLDIPKGVWHKLGGIRGTGTFIHTFGTIYSLKNRYPCVA
ncbi:MAG: WbuC family cupin fold metalloprotein [Bacteroidales bacterium]|nr:WbuC family cupin fold metalloprotein [Bacteroidales bacterium]